MGVAPAAPKPKTALDKVADLQRKLSRKMLRQGRGDGGSGGAPAEAGGVDAKVAQWVALQARTRKMTEEEFTAWYKERQSGMQALLQEVLDYGGEGDEGAEVMGSLCSRISDASGWYPGGYKEIKAKHGDSWCRVERKVEGMLLLAAMRGDMQALQEEGAVPARMDSPCVSSAVAALSKARDALDGYKRRWGSLQESNKSFAELGLRLDTGLADRAIGRLHALCRQPAHALSDLAAALAAAGKSGGRKIAQVDVSAVREATRTCLSMLLDASEFAACGSDDGKKETARACQDLVQAHISLVMLQFQGGLSGIERREVSTRVDEVLKMLTLLDKVASQLRQSKGRGAGQTSSVAGHEILTESLIALTNLLLRHILGKCDAKNGAGESEIVGWLLLGCKFIDKVVRQLEHAKDAKASIDDLLAAFVSLETSVFK